METGDICPACGFRLTSVDGFEVYAPDVAEQVDGYDPAFYAQLAPLQDRHFWFQARNRVIVDALARCSRRLDTFLEIGCGTGQVLRAIGTAFPAARLSGSELFVDGLRYARRRVPDARLMQMDATRIPFVDEFDAIGAFDVVEHISDDRRVIAEIHRALKPGGVAVLTIPQHPWLWSQQDEYAHHQRRYRRNELEGKLREAGFKVAYTTSFVTLLLPLLACSRLVGRRQDHDPLREMRIGNIANAWLAGVLRLEFLLLHVGLRFPVGGSRLVVAVKEH